MIIPEVLGAPLGRTKQTSRLSDCVVDGRFSGPICANSKGGIYGVTLGATQDASPVVTGMLLAALGLGIFGIFKLYGR